MILKKPALFITIYLTMALVIFCPGLSNNGSWWGTAVASENDANVSQNRFTKRLSSVKALLQAYQRAASENKLADSDVDIFIKATEASISAASNLFKIGDVQEGWHNLNKSYFSVKKRIIALKTLRYGDSEVTVDAINDEPSPKDKEVFIAKKRSLEALLVALERIQQEKDTKVSANVEPKKFRGMILQAESMIERGEVKKGKDLLDRTFTKVRKALMDLKSGDNVEYERQAFAKKDARTSTSNLAKITSSVNALLKTYQIIAKSKGKTDAAKRLNYQVTKILEQATIKIEKNQVIAAHNMVDKAYLIVKLSVMELKHGEAHNYELFNWKRNKDKRSIRGREKSLKTVVALLDSYQRIVQEKGLRYEIININSVKSMVDEAKNHFTSGQEQLGMERLGLAYIKLKTAIISLRKGETLVRSLNFKNKEEEYQYELGRSKTHRLLLKLILNDKPADVVRRANIFATHAKKLQVLAETQADLGHFDKAVELMESSINELIKGLRGAGLMLPG
ncbi:MAG: hypothetical protein HQL69_16700 [Magnetococcales bacterium]|nr:hypothetical protein [Magnetococcales bacterium]